MRKNNAADIFLGRFVIVRVSVVVCGNTVNSAIVALAAKQFTGHSLKYKK